MWIELDDFWINVDQLTHIDVIHDDDGMYYALMYDASTEEPYYSNPFENRAAAKEWVKKITNHQ